LSAYLEQLIRRLILRNPTAQLAQLQRQLCLCNRANTSIATLSCQLRQLSLSKKVASKVHKCQDPYNQARYLQDISGIAPANLYFWDKCASAPNVVLWTLA
jgi:hypothetical protein